MLDALHRCLQHDGAAHAFDLCVEGLPHHARTEPRVFELFDERLDLLRPGFAKPLEEHARDRGEEREPFDALRGPLRPDAIARNPPDLFRVGLEEDVIEAAAEPVRDPVFEADLRTDRLQPDPEIAQEDEERVADAEAGEGVHRLEGVVEELAAVVDPREPRTLQHLGAHHRAPELLDGADFGEEAVPADVEAEPLVFDRAGEAADLVVLFEHERADAAPREHPGRREAGGPGAGDDGRFSFLVGHAL